MENEIEYRLVDLTVACQKTKEILDAAAPGSKQHDYYYTLWHNMEALHQIYRDVKLMHMRALATEKSYTNLTKRIDMLERMILFVSADYPWFTKGGTSQA